MDYQAVLQEIINDLAPFREEGAVASYIPELAAVEASRLGISLQLLNGDHFGLGDYQEKFSIQSISKVFALTMAFSRMGESIWKRVGVEPSGNAFNSLFQLEYEKGIPRNPFINAGAMVICDILCSEYKDPQEELMNFVRRLAGNSDIYSNAKVAGSEKETGHRNFALAHLLKSFGNLKNEVSRVLDLYFFMCAIDMTCVELAHSFLFYARRGQSENLHPLISESQGRRLNALMQTCGFYDEAGEFSFKVGLPGKSGVGGGIVAIHPDQYSVAVWSPRLNSKGNSVMGMKVLEQLTTKLGWSIF